MTNIQPIPGFDGYFASDDGDIFSTRNRWGTTPLRKMKQSTTKKGSLILRLQQDGINKMCRVHRLILLTFIGPCPPAMECRHLNGNASDNRLSNLSWGTSSENTQDAISHGTFMGVKP